jgi:hypothetical protein
MENFKIMKKGGGQKAAEIFSATCKQKPSERIIKIVSEILPDDTSQSTPKSQQKKITQNTQV